MGIFKTYIKNASILSVQSLVQRFFGILTSIILARGLGAAALGIYTAIINTSTSVYGFTKLGADISLQIHTAENLPGNELYKKSQIIGSALVLFIFSGLTGSLVIIFFNNWIASEIFGKPEIAGWLKLSSILIFIQTLTQFFYAVIVGLHRFIQYSFVMILISILNFLSIYIGVEFGFLSGAVTAMISVNAISLLLLAVFFYRYIRLKNIRLIFTNIFENIKKILRLGFPYYLSGLIAIPVAYYLQGYITKYSGLSALGYIRIIGTLTAFVSFIPSSISAATISTLTSVRTDPFSDKKKFFIYSIANIKLLWLLSLIIAVFIFIIMAPLVTIIFGDQYLPVITAARISIFTAVLTAVINAISHSFFSYRRVDLVFWMVLIQVIFFLLFSILLIPKMQFLGYIIAEFAGFFLSTTSVMLFILVIKKRFGLEISKIISLYLLNTFLIISLFFISNIKFNIYIEMITNALILIAFVLCSYFFLLNSEEKEKIVELIFSIRSKYKNLNIQN